MSIEQGREVVKVEDKEFQTKLRTEVRKVLRRLNSRAERITSLVVSARYGPGDSEVLGAGTAINSATHLVYLISAVSNELNISPLKLLEVITIMFKKYPEQTVTKVPILELIEGGGEDEETKPG